MIRKNFPTLVLLLAILLMISVVSCDPGKKAEKDEQEKIDNYLNSNSNLNFVKQPSGLYYMEVLAGTGASPVRTDSAYVKYTGKFLSGTVFDSNEGSGNLYGFIIGQNITGFDEGITLMKQGGKATLLIPSKLGYGSTGSYTISGYTPLLFDIELVKFVTYNGK